MGIALTVFFAREVVFSIYREVVSGFAVKRRAVFAVRNGQRIACIHAEKECTTNAPSTAILSYTYEEWGIEDEGRVGTRRAEVCLRAQRAPPATTRPGTEARELMGLDLWAQSSRGVPCRNGSECD